MKKLVLVVVWILVIAVFIVLNYLLWDRESKEKDIRSLENINASNNSSILALGREINNLESDKKWMVEKLSDMEDRLAVLEETNKKLKEENHKSLDIIDVKNEVIYRLVQRSDIRDLETIIRKWVEYIETAQYEKAYELMIFNSSKDNRFMSLEEFTDNYKNSIKSIKLRSIMLLAEEMPEEKRGDIAFKVLLDVVKSEGTDTSITHFTDGENERYFTLVYSKEKDHWVISGIFESY